MKHILLLALLAGNAVAAEPEWRLELVRESLTGTHSRYRQYVDGVATGEYRTETQPHGTVRTQALAQTHELPAMQRVHGRVARRVIVEEEPGRPWLHFVDVESGAILERIPHFYNANPARVFDPNPVASNNLPALRDQNDSGTAVPAEAYRDATVDEFLRNPYVQIVDRQAPNIAPVSFSRLSFEFHRGESGFEDVNAFFHITRNQTYLRSLGFFVVSYPIEVDTHAQNGADNSTFVPLAAQTGRGVLFFGTGGVDDAEDADLIIHEYFHAIHEWISPGTFLGSFASEARALSEGYADYWAFSQHYAVRQASGRDVFCFADWDARCGSESENCSYPANADCLRRLDANRTMADYERSDTSGVEHRNSAIWSRLLTAIFRANVERYGLERGKEITDKLVLESLYGTPPNPTFAIMAGRLLALDRSLFQGQNAAAIGSAIAARGIQLSTEPYNPRSNVLHVQSVQRGVRIPDADPSGISVEVRVRDTRVIRSVQVRVDIDHPSRGDLRLLLTAPDGRTFLLKEVSLDRAPGIHVTYGFDATPVQALDPLAGLTAAGTWSLRVSDQRQLDVGTLRAWSLIFDLEGAAPNAPIDSEFPVIVPTARKERIEDLDFQTQLRLVRVNRAGGPALASVTYIPTGPGGNDTPSTVLVELEPGQTVVFDDVLSEVFRTTGAGKLAIRGVSVTSRTWASMGQGTVGMRVPGLENRVYSTPLPTTLLMQNTSAQRGRIGVTGVSSVATTIRVTIWDGRNLAQLHQETITIPPNEHREFDVPVMGDQLVVEVRGDRSYIAYGVSFDRNTGDPMYIRPTKLEAIPAISARGANGTHWKTDVTITRVDAGFDRFFIPIVFFNGVTGETMSTVVGDPELHATLHFPDIVATLFERPGHWGRLEIGLGPGLQGGARMTSNEGTQTSVPGFVTASTGFGLLAIENNQQFRTNIGVYADIAGPIAVEIYDAAGVVVETRVVEAEAHRLITFPVTARVTHGWAIASVVRGAARVYASVIDNYSGDAMTD